MSLELAFTIRPSLRYFTGKDVLLTASERRDIGSVARRLLQFALSLASNDNPFLRNGIEAVQASADTDLKASIALLREFFTSERLTAIGYLTIPVLAEGVPLLSGWDPNYVADLYHAAFQYRETSRETTTMSDSRIPGFNSNRQQDYQHGLFVLGQHFPQYLALAPASAVGTLRTALRLFTQERYYPIGAQITASLGAYQGILVPDGSEIWDQSGVNQRELPLTMLASFGSHLLGLSDGGDLSTVDVIASEFARAPVIAVAWRQLLRSATSRPHTLGQKLRALAWDKVILTCADTTFLAGEFIRAIYPISQVPDQERIERAILDLPVSDARSGQSRTRLLACLEPEQIVTRAAQ
jgi:hypothetical protein